MMDALSPAKPKLKVLSVDWDLFHDMTRFMPGYACCEIDWVVEYNRRMDSFSTDYNFHYTDYINLKNWLESLEQTVHIAGEHDSIYSIIPPNSDIDLVNLDFHPDLSECVELHNLNCGNWISALINIKKCKINLQWVQIHSTGLGRDLSILASGQKQLLLESSMWEVTSSKHRIGFGDVLKENYDIIFICHSFMYSPPHMNHLFRELIASCKNLSIIDENYLRIDDSYLGRVNFLSQNDNIYVFNPNDMCKDSYDQDLIDSYIIFPISSEPSLLGYLPECDPLYFKGLEFGYSSHGHMCKLQEMYELEVDRGNYTAEKILNFINSNEGSGLALAIWVNLDPVVCMQRYCNDYDLPDTLTERVQVARANVVSINLTNMTFVCADFQQGYLLTLRKLLYNLYYYIIKRRYLSA